jgi:hypothetical protein
MKCEDGVGSEESALRGQLVALTDEWLGEARRSFLRAEAEDSAEGQRLFEHSALCMFNCALQVKRSLGQHESHALLTSLRAPK